MTKTSRVDGRNHSETINQTVYEEINPKTDKLVKVIKGTCSSWGRNKSQTFTKFIMKRQVIEKRAKWKHGYCSSLSNSAWCDLNSKGDILELHVKWPTVECNCKKEITFTLKEFELEEARWKNKNFQRHSVLLKNFFLKPAVSLAAPFIGKAVGAKTKDPDGWS